MNALANKVAIVTGASSGIGRATAKLFASEGAKVVVNARRQSALDSLVAEIEATGGQAIAVAGDVRSENLAKDLVEAALDGFGSLDVAFNNAGSAGTMGQVADISADQWRETLDTNLTSAFFGAKYQVPAMSSGGSLIFTSSFVGHTVGFPGMAPYAASKAGLIGMTKALATELGTRNIRVNAVLPGGTDTPSNAANLPDAAEGTRGFIEGLHALKRLGRPEEIAKVVLHLASDAASFVTGTALLVDGGVSITRS